MTHTRKIDVPEIPPAEYWETHNRSGTKGVKVSILEDTKPENPEPEVEIIIPSCTVEGCSHSPIIDFAKAKPDNDLARKLFAPNPLASLHNVIGSMSNEQFEDFKKGCEDEFLRILLGGK